MVPRQAFAAAFSLGQFPGVAVWKLLAADPMGTEPVEEIAWARQTAFDEWRSHEQEIYERALAECMNSHPQLPLLSGRAMTQWSMAAHIDIQKVLADRLWNEEALAIKLPGVAAATQALAAVLKTTDQEIKDHASNRGGRHGSKTHLLLTATAYVPMNRERLGELGERLGERG